MTVAIDDTLFRRSGTKVWAASWFHDGSAKGPRKTGYGNNWVIAGIIVTLPFCSRPVCLPVMFRLVIKGTSSASRLWLARRVTEAIAGGLSGWAIPVVADAASGIRCFGHARQSGQTMACVSATCLSIRRACRVAE